jgi:hypothetical protein
MWRDAFVAAGGMNSGLQTALDYDLWIRIGKTYPLMKIKGFLATSRMYPGNKTISLRKRVYEEIIRVVKSHYGYVPYDWVYGYAAYLMDRRDQILEASTPSRLKQLLSLLLGCYYNPKQWRRYCGEWSVATGIRDKFTGRWDDGWISKEYDYRFERTSDCDRIIIIGRHLAPFSKGLTLSIFLNDSPLKKMTVRESGPFRIEVPCPREPYRRMNLLKIECNASFRGPKDNRPLSCIIDDITTERAGSQIG